MNDELLAEIPAGRILEEINAQTIAEAWVRVFRRRCPDKWPSVSQVVAGVLAEGRKCRRADARTAISMEKINYRSK